MTLRTERCYILEIKKRLRTLKWHQIVQLCIPICCCNLFLSHSLNLVMTHWKLIKELDANAISEMSYEDIIYISGGFDVMRIGLDLWDDLSRIWLKVVSWRWNFLNCAPISHYPDNSMHFTLIPFLLSISHTKK